MAEIAKQKKKQKVELYEEKEKKQNKKTATKNVEKEDKKSTKKGLWSSFMTFCHGVKLETQKVRWTSKTDMVKYSVATIAFIIFCSIFFYGIDTIFALVQSLFK